MNTTVPGRVIPIALTTEEFDRRLTDRAAFVINKGFDTAKRRHHYFVTAAHLLAGVLALEKEIPGKTFSADALTRSGVTMDVLFRLPEFLPMTFIIPGEMDTVSARQTVTVGYHISSSLFHEIVTEDHIFLAIARPEKNP